MRTKTTRNRKERRRRRALRPRQSATASQGVVGPVAERLAAGCLAAAEPNLFGRLGGERDRRQSRVLMRAVAERLRGAAPAGAPEIALSGLDIDAIGLFLRGYRSVHPSSLPLPLIVSHGAAAVR